MITLKNSQLLQIGTSLDASWRSKSSNGRKIARITPILTIFWRNRSRRPKLFFSKIFVRPKNFSRRRKILATSEHAKARTNSRRFPEMSYTRRFLCKEFRVAVNGASKFLSIGVLVYFHLKSEIFAEIRDFQRNAKFSPKCEIFTEIRDFRRNPKFSPKSEIFVEIRDFH